MKLGFPVLCIDRLSQIKPAIDAILAWTPGEPFPEGIGAKVPELETFRKHMPDGSIMLLTYENGKLVETEKRKPHLVAKADYSRPAKTENGEEKPQIKLVPRLNLLEDL